MELVKTSELVGFVVLTPLTLLTLLNKRKEKERIFPGAVEEVSEEVE